VLGDGLNSYPAVIYGEEIAAGGFLQKKSDD